MTRQAQPGESARDAERVRFHAELSLGLPQRPAAAVPGQGREAAHLLSGAALLGQETLLPGLDRVAGNRRRRLRQEPDGERSAGRLRWARPPTAVGPPWFALPGRQTDSSPSVPARLGLLAIASDLAGSPQAAHGEHDHSSRPPYLGQPPSPILPTPYSLLCDYWIEPDGVTDNLGWKRWHRYKVPPIHCPPCTAT